MSRLEMPAREAMNARQREVYDATVSGPRGKAPAPLAAWLASPELASRAQHLGELVRYGTSLPASLSELAILVTARHWNAHYEWYAHKNEALKAGLNPGLIDAIAAGVAPGFGDAAERVIYRFTVQMHEQKRVDDALYAEAVELLGTTAVVELVGIVGYYTLVAMTLNVFDIGLPPGVAPDLPVLPPPKP
ncbi:carboxymuconolactone decarboxylase family protein [Massilia putida]|uniref:carboxymuconolactone decarboxylase family protein n=1 Tax=Massilia putida TaxID=1141883 RepID=UPI000951E47C|nr:carboxymuconolactone decarboxylase family protein [Massilia putida]